ncbi:MAG: bifunctional 4-hydroxy-2-oxoglutarate aldolase/2-dehydro-3-deoxy-phosphogluconate aldolase [Candidatus Marinimicrobia bacterium]|nr:bifunctional 4-hydroxy-2-oxoglutarate aldolase/2-dehydro-3-deoxy-phosphogluconate aldolase [Candidatus Neomarinimicrobiota bacterium]
MISRNEILDKIEATGIIAVIRLTDLNILENIVTALSSGGVDLLEITFTAPNALDLIQELNNRVTGDFLIGAGTILDSETARAAILAGAQFIVSPVLNTDVIHLIHRYDKVSICGGFSPTEILTAWEHGADIVKVFPATAVGPQFLKDIHAPLPQIKLSPTGGVTLANATDFIKAGACCLGVGTALLDKQLIDNSDWDGLAERARQFKAAVQLGRQG